MNQPDYVLGHSDHELGRLRRQAVLLESITREYLATAGLRNVRRRRARDLKSGPPSQLSAARHRIQQQALGEG